MANFTKKNGKWQARISWYDSLGKRHTKSKGGFETKKEAQLYSYSLEADKDNPQFNNDQSLADYFWEWFKLYKQASLTKITQARYKITKDEIVKYFGTTPIRNVTRRDYQKFINKYGATHAPSTVKKVNNLIGNAVRNAIYEEILDKDFTQGVTIIGNKDLNVKVEYLNIEEIKRLTNYLFESLDHEYNSSNLMILTAIYTGSRIGEIMALTWKDINFNFKTITINKSWDYIYKTGFKPTKNESSNRIIPVNDELLNILKSLKQSRKAKLDDLVYLNRFSDISTSSGVNKQLRLDMDELGIVKKNFHFHSLRHAHVAYLLANGIDLYAIAKRLGHSDIATTSKTYAYLIEEYQQKNNRQILDSLSKLSSNDDFGTLSVHS